MHTSCIETSSIINFLNIDGFGILTRIIPTLITTLPVQLEFNEKHKHHLDDFVELIQNRTLSVFPLSIDDLIEIAAIQENKRLGTAELSCFLVAKRLGAYVLCDDYRANKFAKNRMGLQAIITTKQIIIQAFLRNLVSEYEVEGFQRILERNKFKLKTDLRQECLMYSLRVKPRVISG